jgi:hypothetical protein
VDISRPPWTRRGDHAAPPPGVEASPPGFAGIRYTDHDGPGSLAGFLGGPSLPVAGSETTLRVLALSGGGAGGAFGAGALVGLTRAAARPRFDVVTGVSTGSLIAPYAFLGPDWDDRLASAYTGGFASELLALTALRPGPSLYASEPLAALVTQFVDSALLEAVAQAHADGRRLFVATANLDAQTTSIWDMGAIAAHGGEAALGLFADVLVASASLPGLFPPKMIAVEYEGRTFEEMHVDGGTISPLFIVPEALALHRPEPRGGSRCEVYALVNTTLDPSARSTPLSAVPILVRSFELMLRSSYKSALRSVAAFCQINGFRLHTASIPSNGGTVSMLRFDRQLMAEMFDQGAALAEAGTLWSVAVR